jgi:SAM-dependent methyltransferase
VDLSELRKHWDEFGKRDPLWAILTREDARRGQWDEGAFFATGEVEVAGLIKNLDTLSLPSARRRALDFGCGVGRITRALCRYFEECDGVDIAPSMIRLAEAYNRDGRRCRYHVNASNDLQRFENDSFDLVYSNLVLQHMRPELVEGYVQEFLRVASPEGVVVFEVPSERDAATDDPRHRRSVRPDGRLPDSAFAARIEPEEWSLTVEPGVEIAIVARVKNTGTATWPAGVAGGGRFQVNLGNHWLRVRGQTVTWDDARAHLPRDLGPLEEAVMTLVVRSPSDTGRYLLELDMVQEDATWFQAKGAVTARISVDVRHTDGWSRTVRRFSAWRSRPSAGRDTSSIRHSRVPPRMEMYGVRPDVVLSWVTNSGARLLDLRSVDAAGDWPGFFYYASKSMRSATVDSRRVLASALASILPPIAFQAHISAADTELVVEPSANVTVPARVSNLSPVTWPATAHMFGRHDIRMGNHWLDSEGQMLVEDDGRSSLHDDLASGKQANVAVSVRTPASPGRYILELDMVQEHVAWFKAFGSETVRISVLVR